MRCRECFDEVDPKAFACPRCGAATDYFRSQSRFKLWARLVLYLGLFVGIGVALWTLLANRA